jgi:hypothetical protein
VKADFFDDLARTLATPMPRRRALRTIGTALAVTAFPVLRPGKAGARSTTCKRCFVAIKYGTHEGGCCSTTPGFLQDCCIGPNDSAEHPNQMSWCCAKGGCGASGGKCNFVCPSDKFRCGSKKCCLKARPTLPAEVCYQGNCLPACPATTIKCGTTGTPLCCHKTKQLCRNGKCCDKCGGNGTCCNPATTFCCREPGDPKSAGRCCKKDKESCCGVGPDGAQKRMCCPKPNKCIKQLPKGIGGFTASSPWVCCPPARQVPDDPGSSRIVACCDPSQVSLQGKFLVGQGIQGSCCDADRICGSGASLTCCQTGQSCIGGTTCA